MGELISQSIFNQQERINKFYEGILQQEDGILANHVVGSVCYSVAVRVLVRMKCIVGIGADYPHMPPVFAIGITGVKEMHEIQIKVCIYRAIRYLAIMWNTCT